MFKIYLVVLVLLGVLFDFFYLKESSVLQERFLTFTNGLEYFRIFSVM